MKARSNAASLLRAAVGIAVAALLVFLVTHIFASITTVADTRMLPALRPGDLVLIDRRAPPERGTIVLLRRDAGPPRLARVIGLPGERWGLGRNGPIHDGRLLLHWRVADLILPLSPDLRCPVPLDDADCRLVRSREMLPGGTLVTVARRNGASATLPGQIVPPGALFLLFDDRTVPQPGIVPAEAVAGRARLILASVDRTARWSRPAGWRAAIRVDRMLIGLEPQRAPR